MGRNFSKSIFGDGLQKNDKHSTRKPLELVNVLLVRQQLSQVRGGVAVVDAKFDVGFSGGSSAPIKHGSLNDSEAY